jgi:hypothetical protein
MNPHNLNNIIPVMDSFYFCYTGRSYKYMYNVYLNLRLTFVTLHVISMPKYDMLPGYEISRSGNEVEVSNAMILPSTIVCLYQS